MPVHQNLLFGNPQDARAIARGILGLVACAACGFVFNGMFDEASVTYGERYESLQDCSPLFAQHVERLAGSIARDLGPNARIVEIGCGRGSFLRRILHNAESASAIGYDRSYTGPADECGGRLHFERRFFDETATPGPVDAVICRHVIEHVARPVELLRTLRRVLEESPAARIYFETPCIEWILRNQVLWDVFYEHCSYFRPASLAYAFERAGFSPRRIRHVFSGQYLWLEASPRVQAPAQVADASLPKPAPGAGDVAKLAAGFARAYNALIERWCDKLSAMRGRGKVALWGAGAKGVTLANLVDPGCELLDCLIDMNPTKQGKFVPGTGHAICDPITAAARGIRAALVMNPNYLQENEEFVASAGLPIELTA